MELHHRIHSHLRQHHKKYVGGLFAGFALVKTFVLFAGFFGLTGLASIFAAETEDSIISQYYGEDSVYTTNRTGNSCDTGIMTVQYINNYATSGIDAIPENLSNNTIYILLSGSHITSRTINLADCSAVIGSGNVTIYSSGYVHRILFLDNVRQTIIEHINIDGSSDGDGNTHSPNFAGIQLAATSSNHTIIDINSFNNMFGIKLEGGITYTTIDQTTVYDNTQNGFHISNAIHNIISNSHIYSNTLGGMLLVESSNNIIDKVQAYNTNVGIYLQSDSNNNVVNNVQAYNNDYGIYLFNSRNNTINNTQAYNNGYGIFLINNSSQYNTINHCQIYNNTYGIEMNNSPFNAINNTQLYSNTRGIDTNMATNTYYGTLRLAANDTHFNGEPLIAGSDTDFFSGGTVAYDGEMSCDWIANPMNGHEIFLQEQDVCIQKGRIYDWTGDHLSYLYGTNIIKQTQALQDAGSGSNDYSWSPLTVDTSKYIAEYNKLINSSLVVASGQSYTIESNIQVKLTATEEVDYVLAGDFEESPIAGTLTDTEIKEITLTAGYNTKHISVTYSTGGRTRTFTTQISYADPNGLPFTYFGSGSAYTTNRTGNTCNPGEITIVVLDPGTDVIPNYLSENTIYILNSGAYTVINDYVHPSHCSALIGSGNVTLYSDGYFSRILFFYEATNNIIEHINVDGMGNADGGSHGRNPAGIQFITSSNNTITNSISFNNQYGIKLEQSANNNSMDNNILYDNGSAGFSISDSTNTSISGAQLYNSDHGIFLDTTSGTTITNVQSYDNVYGIYGYIANYTTISGSQLSNSAQDGIKLESSNYNTISNSQIYDNNVYGMNLVTTKYSTISNTQVYHNNVGIYLYDASDNNTIENSQSYNNSNVGIFVSNSSHNVINNDQSYNNDTHGIRFEYTSNNTINNCQVFNNSNEGISLYQGANTTINNSQIYNNYCGMNFTYCNNLIIADSQFYSNDVGIYAYPNGSFNDSYYGTLKLFSNGMDTNVNGQLSAGADFEFFSGGVLDTEGTMSCDWITNPMNTDGVFLVDETQNPTCNQRGKNTSRSGDQIGYLYGASILTQTQVIQDSGTTNNAILSWSNDFDDNKYIAEVNVLLNGSLLVASGQTYTFDTGIQVTLTLAESADYVLSGDFEESPMTGTLTDTETKNITLTTGYGVKHMSVIYSTGDRERTINKTISYVDPDGLPFTYFGSGSAYTVNRSGNTCNPALMTVEYIEPGTDIIPAELTDNTIYILLSGSHISSRQIALATCSALIGSGDVILSPNTYISQLLGTNGKENIIIDSININGEYGEGRNPYNITITDSSDITINNITSYNSSYGIFLDTSSHTTMSNSQIYNNYGYGIYLSDNSNNNTIHNIQSYNNGVGIYFELNSANNTINNSQTYNNNNAGISIQNASNTTINNSQSYNNYYWGAYISNGANNTTINTFEAYNNGFDDGEGYEGGGIYSEDSTMMYYGTLRLFANDTNIVGNTPTAGTESELFLGGVLDEQGTMSCDWTTNPINNEGIVFMDDGDYPNCDAKGNIQDRVATSPTKYLYGSNILKQTQAFKDTATGNPSVLSGSDMFFDPTKYIAEVNPSLNGSLLLASGQTYVIESGIQVVLSVNEPVDYVLAGDFAGSPITGTLYSTVTGTVYLTTGYEIKHITVTYSTGDKERSVPKSIGYISALENYCELVSDLTRTQCDALVALYMSTNGSDWYDNDNRLGSGDTTPTTACDWYGVDCYEGEGTSAIDEIELEENNLSGIIPAQMSGLIDLTYLYLDDNQIMGIASGAFDGVANLRELTLAHNQVTTITSNIFSGLSSLSYLYINDNLITTIASGGFNGLSNLSQLDLSNNHISTIASGAFSDLSNLEQLYLHYNMLTGISDSTFNGLSNLSLLYLNDNQIATIVSGAFNDLPSCRNLFINTNLITTITSDAFRGLSSLQELGLNNNQITSLISGTFSEIPTLEYLYLNSNQITSIEVGAFTGLSDLETLNIFDNQLTTIASGAFNGLSNLSQLDLYDNQLTTITRGAFNGLPNLNSLYISNNHITSFELGAFDGISGLQRLSMLYNDISTIASGIFNGLPNLTQLDLSYNLITDVKDISFQGLSTLPYINLSNNLITTIAAGAFDDLSSCDQLDLSSNLIVSIASGAFNELPNLQYLYLRYNQLGGSLDIFCPLTNLVYLFVDHNRFAGDIPSCLTELVNINDRGGGAISYNYLNTDANYSEELLTYLQTNNRFGRDWNIQYSVADLSLTGTILSLGANTFTLNLGYQNSGWKAADNVSIQYDMLDGMDIEANTEFTTGKIGVSYGGLEDPCFADMYNNGEGIYFDLMEAYAENDDYDNLADMLCSREGLYCGDNSGAGKARADYQISNYDGDPVDRQEEFDDDFDMYLNELTSCGTGGKDIYTFNIGDLDVGETGSILITGAFSNDLKHDGFSNFAEIFSTNEMRIDGHIRNNRFGFTYNDTVASIDETTSLFTDLPEDAQIVTGDISLSEVIVNTDGISFRSENIEAYLPPRVHITTSGAFCDVATLMTPQDKTDEIKALDPTITAAFQIGSACSGTTLIFNTPVRIRMYIPTVLGNTNTFKISRDGITRENITGTKINDHLIEIETSHFSYFKITTSTTADEDNNPAGGGGAGPVKDVCPAQRDCSDSYYDRLCGPCSDDKTIKTTTKGTGSIEGSKYSTELNNAYLRAFGYDITTMPTIQKANMEGKLLRKDMAKMISSFAVNIMGKDISTGVNCEFTDMRDLPRETQYYAIAACRLGLMGYESDGMRTKHTFDPNEEVDRAQFGTILSRLLRADANNSKDIYYEKHLKALKQAGIMTRIEKPLNKELRGYVMLMLMRAAK